MIKVIEFGICDVCQVERELERFESGDYVCKVCGTHNQKPTHAKLIDTTEYDELQEGGPV